MSHSPQPFRSGTPYATTLKNAQAQPRIHFSVKNWLSSCSLILWNVRLRFKLEVKYMQIFSHFWSEFVRFKWSRIQSELSLSDNEQRSLVQAGEWCRRTALYARRRNSCAVSPLCSAHTLWSEVLFSSENRNQHLLRPVGGVTVRFFYGTCYYKQKGR